MPESTLEMTQMNMKMIRRYAMRVGAVAMCSAALFAVPMMAQGGGGGGAPGGGGGGGRMRMTPDQQVAALDTAVTLTADQKTLALKIYTDGAAKIQALMTAQDLDMRTKMTAIRTDENTAIKAILTDAQKPKFDAWLAAQPQGRGGGGGNRPGGGGGGATPPPPPQQ